jgi:hypothetical protein
MDTLGLLLAIAVLGGLVWKFGGWRLLGWLAVACVAAFAYGVTSIGGLAGHDHDDHR